ncbi:MAG: terminase family protein [Puniceicoccales bacterium]|jgi:phage FluMu gp28-like protein|nr:terminase family protein [Puniceicoccales bacterium]
MGEAPGQIGGGQFFLPYQARWILDNSRMKLLEKSRQIGMSWATAYGLVRAHALAGRQLDTWVTSRDDLQARLFIADCQSFAGLLEAACGTENATLLDGGQRETSMAVKFSNGSAIYSMSSNPNAQAGKRGGRVLDEFALHSDPQLLYSIALPGITWGGQLEIISTHRGSQNFFNKLIQEARFGGNGKNFSVHRVTLQDALEQGFLKKLKTKLAADDFRQQMDEAKYFDLIRQSCPDEATFQQEYMCRPQDDGDALLSYELICPCEMAAKEWLQSNPNGDGAAKSCGSSPCYLGVDLGRSNDLSVFWLLELSGDVLITRRLECLRGKSFGEQEQILDVFLRSKNLSRACIDSSGIGRQFVERAVERFGKYRVEGVHFTAQTKECLAYGLRAAMETRGLRIPSSDAIRADLHSIRRENTCFGNVRLDAARTANGHGDRFWALALAVHAHCTSHGRSNKFSASALHVVDRCSRELII